MPRPSAETNLEIYDAPEVASHYATLEYLTCCEQLLFESYIRPCSKILDLGVGGGRTTPYLAKRAAHYVGVDYAPAMVRACKEKFPELEFKVVDAADLSAFSDSEFDAIVFAFNGIDYVFPVKAQLACLQHVCRVLKPGGVFIFSSHNPRAIVVRQQWNRKRLEVMGRRYSQGGALLYPPLLLGLTCAAALRAFGQSMWATIPRLLRRILSQAFWRGEGNIVDPSHGGLLTHCWISERVIDQMNMLDFRLVRVLANDFPQAGNQYTTDWYYYVFAKR